mmetsp:Transcript_28733/g.92511  ORF Transcript_28733/g.92511 Transcript_28733/m.92511 type:complete len:233 (+) Transcript_28733:170-868(+)
MDVATVALLSGVPALVYPSYVAGVKRWWSRVGKTEALQASIARWRWRHNCGLALYSLLVTVYVGSRRPLSLLSACEPSVQARWVLCVWYASKIWEWGDTFFLVTGGKAISRLHYRHHQTTCAASSLTTGVGVATPGPSPVVDVATFLNALAHVLMYSYYSAPSLLRPVRRWITRIQIVQHAVVVTWILRALVGGCCGSNFNGYLGCLLLYVMYLLEFAVFYVKDSKKKKLRE